MKFKVASAILSLFALIGLGLTLFSDFGSYLTVVICMLLYVLVPACGAYGTWIQSRGAILLTLVFFVSQSVRSVGTTGLLPQIAPISIAFPIGDFASGDGKIIDCFALFMALYLGWLLKGLITPGTPLKEDS